MSLGGLAPRSSIRVDPPCPPCHPRPPRQYVQDEADTGGDPLAVLKKVFPYVEKLGVVCEWESTGMIMIMQC